MLRVQILTMENEFIYPDLSLVRVRRPNYPFNCYTLDLSEHEEVKNVGVKQLFITFRTKKNYSMELLLEDKALACNREIKYHKFYFSGPSVELKDLGKKGRCQNILRLRLGGGMKLLIWGEVHPFLS